MAELTEWWELLATELQVFYAVGITASFILVIQVLLMLIGVGVEGAEVDAVDVDVDSSGGDPGGLHLLSVRTMVAFAVGFGWTGVICLKQGSTIGVTITISLLVGSVFMFVIFYLMKALYGLRESGNINYQNAIGKIGSVYVPIPPNQTGAGQVEIMIQGRVRFVQAFTKSDQKLASDSRVKIVETLDARTLLVEPLDTSGPESTEE